MWALHLTMLKEYIQSFSIILVKNSSMKLKWFLDFVYFSATAIYIHDTDLSIF